MLATIGIIIDVAIVLALVIWGIIGMRKGFLKSIISLFSWVVCLGIAFLTAKYVAGWINGIFDFAGLIGDKVSKSLISSNEFFSTAINSFASQEELLAAVPENVNGMMKQLIKVVFSNSSINMQSTESVGVVVGDGIGHLAMVVIAGILVFIVLKIALALLTKLINNLTKSKIIGGLDKVLGCLFGVLKAGFIIVALNVILSAMSLVPFVNKSIKPLIKENTHVEKFIYEKTDDFVGKYVIEGDILQNWVSDMWASRD